MAISFFVSGTARSWRAPRFNRATGNAYKPEETGEKAWQASIWGQAMPHAPAEPWTGPVLLRLTFYLPVPKSWAKWKREMAASGKVWPEGGPDRTNLVKAFEDALKGVFFVDDRQVVKGGIEKAFEDGRGPGVEVRLERLPGLPARKPKECP